MELDPTLAGFGLLFAAVMAIFAVPLAACLFFAAIAVLWLTPGPTPDDFLLNHGLAMRLNSPALISIPLFGLAGELAVLSGISEKLLDLADALASRCRLEIRAIFGCALFATISGVGPAAVVGQGKRLASGSPAMLRDKKNTAGLLACAAALSIVIPASVPLTVYAATIGIVTNIVFAASFIPGLFLAAALLTTAALLSRRNAKPVQPAPAAVKFSRALRAAGWAIALPLFVLVSLFTGFLTAPEAAAFSCAYALVFARLNGHAVARRDFVEAFARAATGAATILILVATSGFFIMLVNMSGLSDTVADALFSWLGGRIGAVVFMNLALLAAGCVMDMPAIITIVAPLLLPLADRSGMSLPHFGVMVVMNIAIGLITPPQAWNLSAACGALAVQPREAAIGAIPYLLVMTVVLFLVSFFPELSLFFPRLFGWPV